MSRLLVLAEPAVSHMSRPTGPLREVVDASKGDVRSRIRDAVLVVALERLGGELTFAWDEYDATVARHLDAPGFVIDHHAGGVRIAFDSFDKLEADVPGTLMAVAIEKASRHR